MAQENADQQEFWDSFAEHWVTNQADLDGLMAPVLEALFARADLQPGQRVLDIGCGTGTSTVQAAHLVGPDGHVTGADISAPMLEQARKSAGSVSNLNFVTADVADHTFARGEFDRVISRFGVMFFADPDAAFCNIARAMKPGARLAMACWAGLEDNPWFRVPMYAAKDRLGAPPRVDPDDPGPLAFRDTGRVRGILERAGFTQIEAEARDIVLTPPGDLRGVASHAASIGPAARALEHFNASEADFEAITNSVAAAFEGFMQPAGARIPAKINFFTAAAPGC